MANLVFAYGRLMKPAIQVMLIGREAESLPDVLEGYRKSRISVHSEPYFAIVSSAKSSVRGVVFAVTKRELAIFDKYETKMYKRKKVALASSKRAWAYVKA